MEKSRDIKRSEGGGDGGEKRQRRDDGSRSEVYFRQDHPIVKRTEIYSRSVHRERERERGEGGEGGREQRRGGTSKARRYRDTTLSGHRAEQNPPPNE